MRTRLAATLSSLALLFIASGVTAQSSVGHGTSNPDAVVELQGPTVDMSHIDIDDLPLGGAVSAAELNTAGDALGSTLAAVDATAVPGAPPTSYDLHSAGGRGLALSPNGTLTTVDAPGGRYQPFGLHLRMGGPVTEFGLATGDHAGPVSFTFRQGGSQAVTFRSSRFGNGSVCWLRTSVPFDEVWVEPVTGTSFTVTDLFVEKGGYGPFSTGCGMPATALRALGDARPRIGRRFRLEVSGLTGNGVAGMLWGFSRDRLPGGPALPLDLSPLGANGCFLVTDPAVVMASPASAGTAAFHFDLPPGGDCLGMTFYNQAFALDPTANAMGIRWSAGGVGVVRW